MKSLLIINANTGEDRLDVSFAGGDVRQISCGAKESQHVLERLMDFLREHDCEPTQLFGIAVIQGAERFTVARVATILCNGLAAAGGVRLLSYTGSVPSIEQMQTDFEVATNTPLKTLYTKEPSIS